MEKFYVDWYNILTIGIDIIGFAVNIVCELVFIITSYIFLFHILFEVDTNVFSLVIFFINSQLSLLP